MLLLQKHKIDRQRLNPKGHDREPAESRNTHRR
jgi:hypothetical protein